MYLLAGLENDIRFVRQATEREPRNPETWYQLAAFEYARAHYCAAYDAASRSYGLDQFGPAGQPGNVGLQARQRCRR
jgi:hypothetical protein